MAGKISDYIQRRNREKLYKQWMARDGLAPEDVPPEVLGVRNEHATGSDAAQSGFPPGAIPAVQPQDISRRSIIIPTRYIWAAALVFMAMLIALSVTVTLLVTRRHFRNNDEVKLK